MGLKRAEAAALAVTLLFLALTLGYRAGLRRRPAEFTVHTAAEEPLRAPVSSQLPAQAPEAALVNINTADEEALCSLNGIGPALAGRIIAYREAHGPFARIEDITRVSGIGSGIYAGVREHICVD